MLYLLHSCQAARIMWSRAPGLLSADVAVPQDRYNRASSFQVRLTHSSLTCPTLCAGVFSPWHTCVHAARHTAALPPAALPQPHTHPRLHLPFQAEDWCATTASGRPWGPASPAAHHNSERLHDTEKEHNPVCREGPQPAEHAAWLPADSLLQVIDNCPLRACCFGAAAPQEAAQAWFSCTGIRT